MTTTTSDPIEALETQMMILVRNVGLLGRANEDGPGMDRAGYLLLRTLEQIGPASINMLADTIGLDSSTVTRQIASMQASGLVARETNPDDRRCSIIRPTEYGVDRMTQFRRWRRDNMASLTSGWSAHERRTLSKMLAKLNDSIITHAAGRQALPSSSRKRRARARARKLRTA